jgi:UDPglucose 6-dehydrogenase
MLRRPNADLQPGLGDRAATTRRSAWRFTPTCRAVQDSDIVFIAVGTPQGEDGSADLQHVLGVAHEIGRALTKYTVIVDKSTVPVGRRRASGDVAARRRSRSSSVTRNSSSGRGIEDFEARSRRDRQRRRAVGGADEGDAGRSRTGAPIMMMDTASAELYAASSISDARSFMNEIANVCELVGADVVGAPPLSDRRIGNSFLFPGVGYGGGCSKDVKALVRSARDKGYEFRILEAVSRSTLPEAEARVQDAGALRRPQGPHDRCGAWRSSRAPTTCAAPRSRSSTGCSSSAPACAPTIGGRNTARRLFGDRIALCEKG